MECRTSIDWRGMPDIHQRESRTSTLSGKPDIHIRNAGHPQIREKCGEECGTSMV
jgi:hypothetical protein